MTNDELRNILEWIENKREFFWSDLQYSFNYDVTKMTLVQNTLRSNMPVKNNLVDHLYVSDKNPNTLVLTANGRAMLINLKRNSSNNARISAEGPVTAGGDIIVGGKKIISEKNVNQLSKN